LVKEFDSNQRAAEVKRGLKTGKGQKSDHPLTAGRGTFSSKNLLKKPNGDATCPFEISKMLSKPSSSITSFTETPRTLAAKLG
jgi:hypothetical protein